jgi:hypothetical protein
MSGRTGDEVPVYDRANRARITASSPSFVERTSQRRFN